MSKQHPDVPHGTTGHPQLGNRVRLGSYVWDPTSGMWYDESSQFYFEEKSKLYTKRNNPHWYVFDTKQKKLVKTDRYCANNYIDYLLDFFVGWLVVCIMFCGEWRSTRITRIE